MPNTSRYDVEQWISCTATGEFHYKDVCALRKVLTIETDNKLRKIMYDICHAEDPICESVGRKDGWYRPIQEMPKPVNWQEANPNIDFPIALPFGNIDLRKYVWIDLDTIIGVAGSKDSGKTGWLMRIVVANMNNPNFHTVFLSNMEGGTSQIRRRFDAMDIKIPTPAPFDLYHVIDNFHDFMKEPNTLYVIDYIDVPESGEFYMIAPALARIQKKLVNSVAVVGLQKHSKRDMAFGGEQTLKKAGLYIALDTNKLKIVRAKVHTSPKINPVNMQWTFIYDQEGTAFTNIQRYEGE